jgi:hypothetical protein
MCAAVSEELRGGPRPWLGWIAWALIVGTLGSIVIQGFRAALGYDEAYNLQVVVNLVHGHGYATNGTLYGDGTSREAFDPAITTGPTLLVPVSGVVLALGEHVWVYRLIPVAYFMILLVAWGRVGRSTVGRPGMWAALAGVLVVNSAAATSPGSPLLGAGDVLGEVAAAALVVVAVMLLSRSGTSSAAWSGLCFGLAVMSKVLVLVAGPAVLIGLLLIPGAFSRRRERALIWLAAAGIPVVAWQAVRVIALGPGGAWTRDREFWQTFRTMGSGLSSSREGGPVQKLINESLMFGGLGVLMLVVVLVVIAVYAPRAPREVWRRLHPVLVLLAGGLSLQIWWTFFAAFPNPRFTVILTFLGLPALLVIAVELIRAQPASRTKDIAALLLVESVVVAILASAVSDRVPAGQRLDRQEAAVAYLRGLDVSSYAVGTWPVPDLALLSGVGEHRLGSSGGLLVLSEWGRINSPQVWATERARCTEVLRAQDGYVFCWVPPRS